jgi:signal transduction histidine kinase/DNA-binding response OmpR family regulator
MAKKLLNTRLNDLFSTFQNGDQTPDSVGVAETFKSWAWECDSTYTYVSCGDEVTETLGLPAASFIGASLLTAAITPESASNLQALLERNDLPAEIDLQFKSAALELVSVRFHIFNRILATGETDGWRGLAQQISAQRVPMPIVQPAPARPIEVAVPEPVAVDSHLEGVLAIGDLIQPAGDYLSSAGRASIQHGQLTALIAPDAPLPALAAPVKLPDNRTALIEVLSDDETHQWSEDEKLLVQEVANQLGLALENAELYASAQQELRERMRAEKENERLYRQTQDALAETDVLYRISSGIAQSKSAQDLVSLVSRHMLPKGAERIGLITVSREQAGEPAEFEIVGFLDFSGKYEHGGIKFAASDVPAFRLLETDGLLIPDLSESTVLDDRTKLTLSAIKIGSGMFIPLRSGGRLVGVLTATATKPTEFLDEDARRLRGAGNNIALALERQRLLGEAQRRALELQTAAEIARDTTSTLSLDALLSGITTLVQSRFNYYHVAIFLVDDAGLTASIREATGEAGAELKRQGMKLAVGSRSVIGEVTDKGEPIIINDTSSNPLFYPHSLLPDTRAEMCIPLKSGTRVIGALDLQSSQAGVFSEDELATLQILADQIAVAIENARSYELAQQAVAEIRELDRMKTQFLANMSHELRTPLNSIIGFSRVILKGIDGPLTDTQKQDLEAIYNSGQHLLTLINEILDLSKIEAGKMELQVEEASIADLVNGIMPTATGLVKSKPIKLETIIQPNLPKVKLDVTKVKQVILNFVSNAVKFTEEGSITIEAKLTTGPGGRSEVIISVADTGSGIAEADQVKLFQPFSQVDDSPTRKTGGTGLGLSISKSFIELHGGRIGLESSEVGKGSTFFFALPVEVQPEIEGTGNEGGSKLILCVDDDEQVIGLYERFLEPHGYQVVGLTDSTRAVARAAEIQPFAITLDVMMPGSDGWAVIHELKSNPDTRSIPVIICSILEEEQTGYSLGAADYLVKPFLQEDLLGAVHRLDMDGLVHTILIVDDDDADLRLVSKLLEENSAYKTVTAKSGEEAEQVLRTTPVEAVILDLFMPGMNGFELLARIRSNAGSANLPVIILTGADLTPEQHTLLAEFGSQMMSKTTLRQKELLNQLATELAHIRETQTGNH